MGVVSASVVNMDAFVLYCFKKFNTSVYHACNGTSCITACPLLEGDKEENNTYKAGIGFSFTCFGVIYFPTVQW